MSLLQFRNKLKMFVLLQCYNWKPTELFSLLAPNELEFENYIYLLSEQTHLMATGCLEYPTFIYSFSWTTALLL